MHRLLQIAQLGHPVLREKAKPVETINDPNIKDLIEDMTATLKDVGGMGIAAPQVYTSKRIFILASHPTPNYPDAPNIEPVAVINPKIVFRSDEINVGWEGCLSVPGYRGRVPRHSYIEVDYFTVAGRNVKHRIDGFPAIIFQHEYDHLEGRVFIDRMKNTLDLVTEKEFQRLKSRS